MQEFQYLEAPSGAESRRAPLGASGTAPRLGHPSLAVNETNASILYSKQFVTKLQVKTGSKVTAGNCKLVIAWSRRCRVGAVLFGNAIANA